MRDDRAQHPLARMLIIGLVASLIGIAIALAIDWFPTGATVQDRIVSALLAGPTDWLQQGVVASAFPAGVKLGSPVAIRNSTATVDFTANAASTKEPALGRMRAFFSFGVQGIRRGAF